MWVPSNSNCPLPFGAVSVGIDKDGSQLYAGRAHHQGDLLPSKINPNHISAYVCWGGLEHAKNDYEVRTIIIIMIIILICSFYCYTNSLKTYLLHFLNT